jgi:hypothetical protein
MIITNAFFKGRDLLIATNHKKETVIAPLLEKELGVNCTVPKLFDTDTLGTFTGEVERKDNPLTTARTKCILAIELMNCDLAVASEGSFGPHPTVYFTPADEELLIFIDKKNNLEIVVKELSTETNFDNAEIKTEKALKTFAHKVGFPSHGLIIRKAKDDVTEIVKGITNTKELNNTFKHFISTYGTAFVETDMRAMYNPTRMKVIEKATKKLADKLNSFCPNCNTPGFGFTDAKAGLPCMLCNFPTHSTLSYIYSCQKCAYTNEKKYPNGKHYEDPMFCDICNP